MSHPVLPIVALSYRHPGLTPVIAVCLNRHHDKPLTIDRKDSALSRMNGTIALLLASTYTIV